MLYILECFVCILSARPIFSDQLDVFIQIKVNVLVKSLNTQILHTTAILMLRQ